MKNLFRGGAYIWTASGAGWVVIGGVTGIAEALAVGIGCVCMAGLWLILSEVV